MHAALKKLLYRGQDPILVMNAPAQYSPVLKGLACRIDTRPRGKYSFIQVFCITRAELEQKIGAALAALDGDSVFWICYPKKTSKSYTSDLSREMIWAVVQERGFEGVAMVAIDDDWSAFRVRAASLVKKASRHT